MTVLHSLLLTHVRNLRTQSIQACEGFNCFFGNNGAGKTSILESIYALSTGKSFRASTLSAWIGQPYQSAQVAAQLQGNAALNAMQTIKYERHQQGRGQSFVAGQPTRSTEMAVLLPVQILNLDTYRLLGDAPEVRRKWLDWMMFHVEHTFREQWKVYHRVLQQRNACLKWQRPSDELSHWTACLAEKGEALHQTRLNLWEKFLPLASTVLKGFPGVIDFSLNYLPGWSGELPYAEKLAMNLARDKVLGYTHEGPHRADFTVEIQGHSAAQLLSTGQQKTFVTGLQIAQLYWVNQETEKTPILLVDDLPSELDQQAKELLLTKLSALKAQVWITAVEASGFLSAMGSLNRPWKMFHVEQGVIHPESMAASVDPASMFHVEQMVETSAP